LEAALRERLAGTHATIRPHGFWLVAWGVGILAALAFWVAEDPGTIVGGLDRFLNP
jgi:hypothetical protein